MKLDGEAMRTKTARRGLPRLIASFALVAAACDMHEPPDGAAEPRPREATVLLAAEFAGAWPTGLDPATSTTAGANLSLMNAIYGGLFQLTADDDGSNPRITGVLASGYEIEDGGRTVVIRVREGVRFSDGTPLDAEAVRFNVERNLRSPCVCAPTAWPWDERDPVRTRDALTVELRFRRPYAAVMNTFPTMNVNWVVSPAALESLGEEELKLRPVGAGPFRVVSNVPGSRLVLERNPYYWQPGRPYLDRLVFQSIGSEQAAYNALLAGDAHAFEGLTLPRLIGLAEADDRLRVTRMPATSPYVVQLNTSRPPFDDKRAREAIYHATDVEAIRVGIFNGWYPWSRAFTAPGGLFHIEDVPGYRSHDPERARAIVAELGGLRVTLGTLRSAVAEQIVTALQSQWRRVGIDVEIELYDIARLVQEFQSGRWQAMLQTAGSFDPEAVSGVSSRFRSDRPFTGVKDPVLDDLLERAAGTFDTDERRRLYTEAARHISDHAYAPFLLAYAPAQLTTGALEGPGLTTPIPPLLVHTGVLWHDVRRVDE